MASYNSPMEATEMQEFSRQMQESNEAKGEASTKAISLAISVLAVLVAMVTVLGHRTHTEAVLRQSRVNDAWSEYQAKKIRFDNLTVTVDLLPAQPTTDAAATAKNLAKYRGQLDKWTHDLDQLQHSARDLETEVAHAEHQAARYDLGEALLQIAVVLASITLLTRRSAYFFFGLTLGLAGLITAASALLVH